MDRKHFMRQTNKKKVFAAQLLKKKVHACEQKRVKNKASMPSVSQDLCTASNHGPTSASGA